MELLKQTVAVLLMCAMFLLAAAGCSSEKTDQETSAGDKTQQETPEPGGQETGDADTRPSGEPNGSVPSGGSAGGDKSSSEQTSERKEPSATLSYLPDPRLQAPASTLIAPVRQTVRIKFGQPMDKSSVEQAILSANVGHRGQEGKSAAGKLEFQWTSDDLLDVHLLLNAKDGTELPASIYAISVSGSKTADGKALENVPGYQFYVHQPEQLWRISTDGTKTEQLTELEMPYGMEVLDPAGRYVLLSRHTGYCECDAPSPRLFSVYDLSSGKLTDYPVALSTLYMGGGTFTADRRGFLYEGPVLPGALAGGAAVTIRLDGEVKGAQYSKNRKAVIAAVGERAEQNRDFDLVIIDLETGEQKRLPKALVGLQEQSMVSAELLPVSFYDDGQAVYTRMYKEDGSEIRYRYVWAEHRVEPWNAPKEAEHWSGFAASADGRYRMYANAGLYDGESKRADAPPRLASYPVQWLGDSHKFVYLAYEEQGDELNLYAYDVDRAEAGVIKRNLAPASAILGASADGKWIYLSSAEPL